MAAPQEPTSTSLIFQQEGLSLCKPSAPSLYLWIQIRLVESRKNLEDQSTLTFIVSGKAKEHQVKQAVEKLHDADAAKVNALPDQTCWREEGMCLTGS
ncbi:60S ribosomal protein L23a [Camelus dromedarius]|uniref:60S ribosomal protein L23a n=1 Tax=Camelus dromedarius TaxID=9838 RepID=A0A5N4EJW0_CAMDR|nr:60S ribosomal protein L23a [Camelus dromedarius]